VHVVVVVGQKYCKKNTNDVVFGRVTEPCRFCNCKPLFHVYNASNQLKYVIEFSCCNWNCCDYKANIYNGNNKDVAIGTVVKKASLKDYFLQCTTFEVVFPNDATPENKMLLISNTLLIDYRLFERKLEKDETDHRYHR